MQDAGKKGIAKILANRKFKYGSFATLIAAGFVAVVVILNIIATVLVDRFPLTLDLTKDSVFSLSEDSVSFIKGLNKDVNIIVLANKEDYLNASDYYAQSITVLDNYQRYSGHIKIEYVDIVKNPAIVSQYPDLALTAGDILIKTDSRSKKIKASDLLNTTMDYNYYQQVVTSSKAEQVLSSAIEYVTAEETVLVSLITGHEELTTSGLNDILSLNNYETVTQKLLGEEINPEAKFIVINSPKRDFTAEELKALDVFLDNNQNYGKTLLYFADSDQPELPNLEAYLEEWGISVGEGIVYETDKNLVASATNPFYTFTENASSDYTTKIAERSLDVLVPFGRPLNALFENKGNLTVTKLLGYSAGSRLYPADAGENYTPSENDPKGPFGAAIRSTKLRYDGTTPLTTNVIAFASSVTVDASITTSSVTGNAEYIAELINTVSEKKSSLSIVSKTVGAGQITITGLQVIMLGLVFLILVPLGVLITGVVIWVRRRNR